MRSAIVLRKSSFMAAAFEALLPTVSPSAAALLLILSKVCLKDNP